MVGYCPLWLGTARGTARGGVLHVEGYFPLWWGTVCGGGVLACGDGVLSGVLPVVMGVLARSVWVLPAISYRIQWDTARAEIKILSAETTTRCQKFLP